MANKCTAGNFMDEAEETFGPNRDRYQLTNEVFNEIMSYVIKSHDGAWYPIAGRPGTIQLDIESVSADHQLIGKFLSVFRKE